MRADDSLDGLKDFNQQKRGGLIWQTTQKEIKVSSKAVEWARASRAAASMPPDGIHRMIVQPVASRAVKSQAAWVANKAARNAKKATRANR